MVVNSLSFSHFANGDQLVAYLWLELWLKYVFSSQFCLEQRPKALEFSFYTTNFNDTYLYG